MGNFSLLNVLLASSYSNSCFLNSKLRMLTPSSIPLRSSQTISFFAVKSPACTCSQHYKRCIPKQENKGLCQGCRSAACSLPSLHLPAAPQAIRNPAYKSRGHARGVIASSDTRRHKAG